MLKSGIRHQFQGIMGDSIKGLKKILSPSAVKNFLGIDLFLPNFVQINQIILPLFLANYEHLIEIEIFKFYSARSVDCCKT
jgi:hypothetical protein